MSPAPFNQPPVWANGRLTLYHGTLWTHAQAIQASGTINPALGRPGTDFGPGFYTTTSKRQARSWAWQLASQTGPGVAGGVVTLEADRDRLAQLESLGFIRDDYHADDFWSLIFHCRLGATHHARSGAQPVFDVVYGPVAAFWTQRMAITGADQISFHTPAAAAVLNVLQIDPVP